MTSERKNPITFYASTESEKHYHDARNWFGKKPSESDKSCESEHAGDNASLDLQSVIDNEFALLLALNPALNRMHALLPATFQYLKDENKALIRDDLRNTYYLLVMKYRLHKALKSSSKLISDLLADIETCDNYINQLTHELQKTQTLTTDDHQETSPLAHDSSKPPQAEPRLSKLQQRICDFMNFEYSNNWWRYIALFGIVMILPELARDFYHSWHRNGLIDAVIENITIGNGSRLYWVWGGGFLVSSIQLFIEQFRNCYNAADAYAILNAPANYLGYASWVVYYVRLGLDISAIYSNWLDTPFKTADAAKINSNTLFWREFSARKYRMANDLIWGTINYLCFAVLVGSPWLIYANNTLTIVLLMIDTALTTARVIEDEIKYRKGLAIYQKELDDLETSRRDTPTTLANDYHLDKAEQALAQQQQLKSAIAGYKHEWRYKRLGNLNDVMYSALLVGAFALCVSFAIPPAFLPMIAVTAMGVGGAFACFSLGLIYEGIRSVLEIQKMRHATRDMEKDLQKLIGKYQQITDVTDDKKRLFIEIQQLQLNLTYEQRKTYIEMAKHIHATVLKTAIPFVIFASLVFAPTGIGIGIIVAAAVTAFVSYRALCLLEPKAPGLVSYSKDEIIPEMNRFNNYIERSNLPPKSISASLSGFFNGLNCGPFIPSILKHRST